MDINSIATDSISVVDSAGAAIAGTVSLDALQLNIIFTPTSSLKQAEIYTASLKATVTDLAGNALAAPYIWSFVIGNPIPSTTDLTPPYVTSTSPALGNAATPLTSTIQIQFSEAIAADTANTQTLTVTDSLGNSVSGSIALDVSGTSITFTPDSSLLDSEAYLVVATTGIKDSAGNAMTHNYSYTFKTNSSKVVQVITGPYTFYALKENGTLWGWGKNHSGQIGDGTTTIRSLPVRINISDVKDVAQGATSTFALKNDGTVWGWGDNRFGQQGDGSNSLRLVPTQITTISDVAQIAAASYTVYALKSDGTLWAWGLNLQGNLGNGTTSSVNPNPTPVQVQGLSGTIKQIAAGVGTAIVLTQTDPQDPTTTTAWLWGNNNSGQIGDGTTTIRSLPVQLMVSGNPLTDIKTIISGSNTFAALTNDRKLYTWGDNRYGQTGNQSLSVGSGSSFTNTPYLAMENVVKAFMGSYSRQIYTIKADGNLWMWGDDSFGQLGIANTNANAVQKSPLKMGAIKDIASVVGSAQGTAILKTDGSIITAGYNLNGQLGNGSASFATYNPYHMLSVPPAAAISVSLANTGYAGKNSYLLLADDGTVWAWGSNYQCEMGMSDKSGTKLLFNSPVQVAPTKLKNIVAISRGGFHSLALADDGTVWAWGKNSSGQLGNGSASSTPTCDPVKVIDPSGSGEMSGVTSISAGFESSVFIKKDPATSVTTGYAAGYNGDGQLGIGSFTSTATPTLIPDLPTNVKKISSGSAQYMVITESGTLFGWGNNSAYRAGNLANTNHVNKPTQITSYDGGTIDTAIDTCTGAADTLVLLSNGTVLGWGVNASIQPLGVSSTANPLNIIMPVHQITNAVQLGCDSGRSYLALTNDGQAWTWGSNAIGELGIGNTIAIWDPQLIPNPEGSGYLSNVSSVGLSSFIKNDGSLWVLGFLPDGDAEYISNFVNITW